MARFVSRHQRTDFSVHVVFELPDEVVSCGLSYMNYAKLRAYYETVRSGDKLDWDLAGDVAVGLAHEALLSAVHVRDASAFFRERPTLRQHRGSFVEPPDLHDSSFVVLRLSVDIETSSPCSLIVVSGGTPMCQVPLSLISREGIFKLGEPIAIPARQRWEVCLLLEAKPPESFLATVSGLLTNNVV